MKDLLQLIQRTFFDICEEKYFGVFLWLQLWPHFYQCEEQIYLLLIVRLIVKILNLCTYTVDYLLVAVKTGAYLKRKHHVYNDNSFVLLTTFDDLGDLTQWALDLETQLWFHFPEQKIWHMNFLKCVSKGCSE